MKKDRNTYNSIVFKLISASVFVAVIAIAAFCGMRALPPADTDLPYTSETTSKSDLLEKTIPGDTKTPDVTEESNPTKTLEQTETPKATKTPKPTVTPKPTYTPKPTATPKPTRTPKPTVTPKPTRTPKPTVTLKPTRTPKPTVTHKPTGTPKLTDTPSVTPNLTQTPEYTCSVTPDLTETPDQTIIPDIPVVTPNPTPYVPSDVKITFINQRGESILIQNGDKTVLIDAGYDSVELIKYMNDNNISKIDYLIITNWGADHSFGIKNVIKYYDIECVIAPELFDDTMDRAGISRNENINYIEVKDKDLSISCGDMNIKITAPRIISYIDEADCYSLVTTIEHMDNRILLLSALRLENAEKLIEEGFDFSCNIIKLPEYGSKDNINDELLDKFVSQYAVITYLTDIDGSIQIEISDIVNSFESKGAEVINMLEYIGNAVFVSDGKTILIK